MVNRRAPAVWTGHDRVAGTTATTTPSVTQLVDTAAAIDAVEWDDLVGPGDLFCSHAWLRHLDEAATAQQVVTVRAEGRLIGAAPLWDGESEPGLFHLPSFFPGLPGPWQHPFVWLGARRSVRNGLICVRGPRRAPTLSQLLNGGREHAKENGRAGVILPYLPVDAATELARAHPGAQVLLHSADAVIAVPEHGTAELVANASGHNRKRRRRELREFASAGFSLEWVDPTPEVIAAIVPLITATRRRYGSRQGDEWLHRVFAAQRRVGLLEDAKVLLCRRNNALATVAVCYRHGDSLHGRYFGADETRSRDGYPYFVTTCYAPIDYAAQQRLPRLFLSTSSLEAKIRRGATIEPLAAVVVLADGELDIARAATHNSELARAYLDRFTGYSASLSSDWLDFLS
ncbi:peptidogalycan biosysnthesis protein [Nocardia sp. NPDC052254]|uniref:peptidogalycan biosysnthesis protein n=1 Tax=Nocardia sp. NPDC052254 TaxID=3155681 RepID=UPI00342BF8D7